MVVNKELSIIYRLYGDSIFLDVASDVPPPFIATLNSFSKSNCALFLKEMVFIENYYSISHDAKRKYYSPILENALFHYIHYYKHLKSLGLTDDNFPLFHNLLKVNWNLFSFKLQYSFIENISLLPETSQEIIVECCIASDFLLHSCSTPDIFFSLLNKIIKKWHEHTKNDILVNSYSFLLLQSLLKKSLSKWSNLTIQLSGKKYISPVNSRLFEELVMVFQNIQLLYPHSYGELANTIGLNPFCFTLKNYKHHISYRVFLQFYQDYLPDTVKGILKSDYKNLFSKNGQSTIKCLLAHFSIPQVLSSSYIQKFKEDKLYFDKIVVAIELSIYMENPHNTADLFIQTVDYLKNSLKQCASIYTLEQEYVYKELYTLILGYELGKSTLLFGKPKIKEKGRQKI